MRVELPAGLGQVTPMTASDTADFIEDHAAEQLPTMVLGNLNLHALYLLQRDQTFATYCASADYTLIDGWPVLKLAQRSAEIDLGADYRVGSTDWLDELIRRNSALDVVSIGGTPETAAGVVRHVRRSAPSMRWSAFDGFDLRWRAGTGSRIALPDALAVADLVLVGMGMPRQELWILENRHLIASGVIANVGGCLDYYAGAQQLAPRWMGRLGIEWLYRLAKDPKRLAHRYLVEPFKLLAILAGARTRSQAIGSAE